ncbi:hypothetical protein FF80_02972 [Devosia sp. LC5]|uniref:DUF1127 domain-containing protein n=1 Tax=Devosia sp. LC5 TaxID=1502724 RepID=UPI0004E2BA1D|nr:DUF1127 domain-containing protein [Devosia sp. LC5]KFC64350.1 hypothetical protein FF80_02972 [Devosia sp. LC5]
MLQNLFRRVHAVWQDHVALRILRSMDDRQLADLGASRDCLSDFVRNHASH